MTGARIDGLIARERLPASYKTIVEHHWRPLAAKIARWRQDKDGPIVIGVNGAQGSGKTTLCVFLSQALLPEIGLKAAVISLDDFYLPKTDRIALAEKIHPLLRTRGVPGTHDAAMLGVVIDKLRASESAAAPIFDKGADDRSLNMRHIDGPLDVILFEGWCVGAVAQEDAALIEPVNALESDEDKECAWRRYVNERLKTDYKDLFARIDKLIMLRVDGMETVFENRLLQERKLRAARPDAPDLLSDEGVARFIQHYERLTRHCLETLPDRADIVIDVATL
ncbi:kinase [Hyphococcus sp.]|jgi:D-glycerate 3-kinase|uniref:kinase n=1 Tax=Hyphococcus sp. TaxID=2038636 RepID=UPI003D0FAE8B